MIRTLLCIAAIWGTTGVAFVFGVGRVAVAIVSVLYLASVAVMFLRYRSSQFGRTWIPRLFGQYFEWSPLVRLRRLAPPLGSLLANTVAVGLAAHLPLVIWFGLPFLAIELVARRGVARP